MTQIPDIFFQNEHPIYKYLVARFENVGQISNFILHSRQYEKSGLFLSTNLALSAVKAATRIPRKLWQSR
jgi:hypothetical protein